MIKVGIIGLDSSHPVSLSRLFHYEEAEYYVPGARITAAFAGGDGSETSRNRLRQFTPKLVGQEGVELMDSPQAVAENCDALIISALDARLHEPLFRTIAPYQIPVFIDKPIALTREEASRIFDYAAMHRTPVMSCSARRFDPQLTELVKKHQEAFIGVDSYGPLRVIDSMEGLFWYGIHGVEAMYTALGTGCRAVHAFCSAGSEHYIAEWNDGRTASLRLYTHRSLDAGMVVHTEQGSMHLNFVHAPYPILWGLARQLVQFFSSGIAPVDEMETLEMLSFIEAANACRRQNASYGMKIE
ncbi:Gfo/Idh/MocA family oxidoreductase [Paenibacillus sp. IB182496]|uniref:Gfo/Idh/MocA family oxidoreductase n=1 Tax=Paenibacillus sabuli TaxID=2772509 RepID=A0A927BQV7_9BACL|nr:Gfo/Idh/MocA family oxidoreductase [Paenibacillus sabuli]MBD2844030.1 Gfo/Idh/MocA family oxidoreductase [Paenibacillus sabuli]